MFLTYTDIKNQFLRNVGKANSTDTTLLADFNNNLGARYQLALSKMENYVNQTGYTASTVTNQQYYHYPVGIISLDAVTVTVGSVQYPLATVYDQTFWNTLNALQIQPTAIPQYVFPRQEDFGIWPIPQGEYTITIQAFNRDRNLLIDDYTTGTVSVTAGSAIIEGTGGATFTTAMVGRSFSVTLPTVPGQGYDYKVANWVDATHLTLGTYWAGSTATLANYRIGEVPQLPPEGGYILVDGTTSDFYAGFQSNPEKATWFNNKFYTGDGNNNQRDTGDDNITAGLIGLMNRYQGRDNKRLIKRLPQPYLPQYTVWATTISGS